MWYDKSATICYNIARPRNQFYLKKTDTQDGVELNDFTPVEFNKAELIEVGAE